MQEYQARRASSIAGLSRVPSQAPRHPPPTLTEPRPRSGGFDGPGEPSRGPPGSPAKSTVSTRQNPFGPGLGYDPARPVIKTSVITNTRVELPAAAYALDVSIPFISYTLIIRIHLPKTSNDSHNVMLWSPVLAKCYS